MSSDILLRSLLAIGIIVVGMGAYWLVNQRLLTRARNNVFSLFTAFQSEDWSWRESNPHHRIANAVYSHYTTAPNGL